LDVILPIDELHHFEDGYCTTNPLWLPPLIYHLTTINPPFIHHSSIPLWMLMVGLTTIFTHPLLQHVTDIYLG